MVLAINLAIAAVAFGIFASTLRLGRAPLASDKGRAQNDQPIKNRPSTV
jgi:hypothetical protein